MAVGVVLEKVDVAADPLTEQPLLSVNDQVFEDPLTGPIMVDQLYEAVALGRRVLGVGSHVQVDP